MGQRVLSNLSSPEATASDSNASGKVGSLFKQAMDEHYARKEALQVLLRTPMIKKES